jgi:hypothetical protein
MEEEKQKANPTLKSVLPSCDLLLVRGFFNSVLSGVFGRVPFHLASGRILDTQLGST